MHFRMIQKNLLGSNRSGYNLIMFGCNMSIFDVTGMFDHLWFQKCFPSFLSIHFTHFLFASSEYVWFLLIRFCLYLIYLIPLDYFRLFDYFWLFLVLWLTYTAWPFYAGCFGVCIVFRSVFWCLHRVPQCPNSIPLNFPDILVFTTLPQSVSLGYTRFRICQWAFEDQ